MQAVANHHPIFPLHLYPFLFDFHFTNKHLGFLRGLPQGKRSEPLKGIRGTLFRHLDTFWTTHGDSGAAGLGCWRGTTDWRPLQAQGTMGWDDRDANDSPCTLLFISFWVGSYEYPLIIARFPRRHYTFSLAWVAWHNGVGFLGHGQTGWTPRIFRQDQASAMTKRKLRELRWASSRSTLLDENVPLL
jgi:hypothetical protein